MALYHYGGVYADLDTLCRAPVYKWAPAGCHIAFALENDIHFCQWALASVAGHGVLAHVLDLVVRRMIAREYANSTSRDLVHQATGPAVFTEGVLRFLGIDSDGGAGGLERLHKSQAETLRVRGICMLTPAELLNGLESLRGVLPQVQRVLRVTGPVQSQAYTQQRAAGGAAGIGVAPP